MAWREPRDGDGTTPNVAVHDGSPHVPSNRLSAPHALHLAIPPLNNTRSRCGHGPRSTFAALGCLAFDSASIERTFGARTGAAAFVGANAASTKADTYNPGETFAFAASFRTTSSARNER